MSVEGKTLPEGGTSAKWQNDLAVPTVQDVRLSGIAASRDERYSVAYHRSRQLSIWF
jgi:hypothetical protein